jgi:hypothetical protein
MEVMTTILQDAVVLLGKTAAFANTTDCVFFNMTPLIYGNNIEKASRHGLKQVSDGDKSMDILG